MTTQSDTSADTGATGTTGGEGQTTSESTNTNPASTSAAATGTDTGSGAADSTDAGADGAETGNTSGSEQQTGAPETYADFTVPDGVAVDQELLGEFTTTAKALNLRQEDAQKLADLGAKMAQKISNDMYAQHQANVESWVEQVKADPEIGGDKLEASLAVVPPVLKTFGSDALVELLDQTGYGNHPAIVKFFVNVGKAIGEDTLVPGGANTAGGEKTIAQRMYPNMKP
ncbi:hypothetical protein [Methylomonas koyamae]|uniref:hypothetical protein n=1 Tax=Methylomonas koyamae TaxID=702114 RepID=UPI00112ED309|nr:hypothetical protein [Methylomonas koyamae]TPQ24930.1 hypothetical protein C2U68_17280 [Methylomonas koyamae]